MPTVRHPCALDEVPGYLPGDVKVAGEVYDVADDGTVSVSSEREVEVLAAMYDLAPSDLRAADEPQSIEDAISAGECPWCSDYEGDHVGQHASSAHPEVWDAYTSD